ncbi:hypothetical protein G6F57_002876 [Rhizopus arrhizus]|jgi:hypothetical protein|uniref:Uncharacterized protein n=1 Tax=Rhizopus oryzae TaxID=64495 RepID=A0A9P7BVR5_RHIOR|nr:hypothetical protein G6F23_000461 [Rhizopus arrhizus]KAG1428511.1 hypothetical protein G6F58_000517 [Rhizopus delemar]KAG0765683.1 hypothetical protein G6F24_004225 [Rhizopus arrhizus]KAG0791894.1 hypothetical protein G6F22_006013 [Rhizopus arrhizus]KAG0794502.1 hypothetical protein G6F21_002824 [Rhizopus arrhizus]
MSILTSTLSQVARRSVPKKTLVRTYFATRPTTLSKNEIKQKQDELQHQASSPESTVYVHHEPSDSEASFNPIINHVFDD